MTPIPETDQTKQRDRNGRPSIPRDADKVIEVPASGNSISEAKAFMHHLSLSPSMKERRSSRNSFSTSLPIPRSPRVSRTTAAKPNFGRQMLAARVQELSQAKVNAVKNMAFAFDIDGVFVYGNEAIEEGKAVLRMLNGDNELAIGIQFPYILLTNGGGKTEELRCQQLSEILEQPISTNQFIQSHTPMQALSEYYETVLVCGGEGYKIRDVAEQYGFKNVIHPKDIIAWDPTISPCRRFTEEDRAGAKPRDFSQINFDAILVFAESYDAATDLQIINDLLMSDKGRLLTRANKGEEHIPIYFSQGDLVSPTEHKIPRLHLGAFRLAVEAQYKALSGQELQRVLYGKPERATYVYSDEVLAEWMEEIHGEKRLPENIYMVGDNPQSDIIGGNMYGWKTCLVRTGVFQGGENDVDNPANFGVFKHVLDAVKGAIRKECGEDFGFKWDPNNNPVVHAESSSAVE